MQPAVGSRRPRAVRMHKQGGDAQILLDLGKIARVVILVTFLDLRSGQVAHVLQGLADLVRQFALARYQAKTAKEAPAPLEHRSRAYRDLLVLR